METTQKFPVVAPKISEQKIEKDVPVKRKGRGQFKAPTFESHPDSDSKTKSDVIKPETKEKENKIPENKNKICDADTEEIISKMQELRIDSKSSDDNNKLIKPKTQETKPSSRDRNTPGRDPSRPATTDMVARRLIHGALGVRVMRTSEQRQEDNDILQKAREKRQAEKDALK